ncbi:MAG: aminotransferase class I/II-fold pyridoxal phosphate-dependent enzyme [Planctomycetes bacterium]|nr:aminotransferase class I/II-fold pyridoxal phosphate-dependent enzyme [Planctomycetota bacterium]MCB9904268.1 aminotransferase class I/II-fold pyridoxal phosphate-dependent enzyme [Planctomycetota bacterium]
MRQAMANAVVGDDVLDGDPTVRELESFAARWLGKDGALYVPSGTMANQIALGCWLRPGDEVIAAEDAHVLLFEGGAAGFLHGAQSTTLPTTRGVFDESQLRSRIRPDFIHCPPTALICVEETHMGSGGSVIPLDALRMVRRVADERGLPVHMDGARLANAHVASGVPAADFAACADSVAICLSKGLGAPVGSIVAGDADFIQRAKRVRKRLGGWMRQAGVIAAAGLHALEHHVERLAEDHALAKQLAERLGALPGLVAPRTPVETNLVLVGVDHPRHDPASLAAALAEHGVLVMPLSPTQLRFVTHMDVGEADLDRLVDACAAILG